MKTYYVVCVLDGQAVIETIEANGPQHAWRLAEQRFGLILTLDRSEEYAKKAMTEYNVEPFDF